VDVHSDENMRATTTSQSLEQSKKADSMIDHVKDNDLRKLSFGLLSESIGTQFQNTAVKIAKSWLEEIKKKQNSQLTVERLIQYMETVQPNYRLIISLSKKKRAFIDRLFGMDTTLYILSDKNADNLYIISSNPTTANIFDYCTIYSDTLIDGCKYFGFMVHGENEVDDKEYIKITKGEWNAFGR